MYSANDDNDWQSETNGKIRKELIFKKKVIIDYYRDLKVEKLMASLYFIDN